MAEPRDISDLSSIIEASDADLLRTFLLKQAKQNRTLEIKLRAHLIESMESSASVNKYSEVISLLVRHNVHGTIRLTKRSLQVLRDVCAHFVQLQAKYLQAGELRSAWEVGSAVISHLHIFMDTYHGPDPKLCTSLSDCYHHICTLLQRYPAPELRQSIYSALSRTILRNQHAIHDIRYNAVTCMILAVSDPSEYQDISDLVVGKILNIPEAEEAKNLMWYGVLLKIPGVQADLVLQIPQEHSYAMAHLLHSASEHAALSVLLDMVTPPAALTVNQLKQWSKWKFDLALASGNTQNIRACGWKLLTLDQDINTYRRIKASTLSVPPILEMPHEGISNALRCAIYAEEQQWTALVKLIQENHLLPELTLYCRDILTHHVDAQALILEVTVAHATHHGGPQVIGHTSELVETLVKLEEDTMANMLSKHLITAFPGRFDILLRPSRRKQRQKSPIE